MRYCNNSSLNNIKLLELIFQQFFGHFKGLLIYKIDNLLNLTFIFQYEGFRAKLTLVVICRGSA